MPFWAAQRCRIVGGGGQSHTQQGTPLCPEFVICLRSDRCMKHLKQTEGATLCQLCFPGFLCPCLWLAGV